MPGVAEQIGGAAVSLTGVAYADREHLGEKMAAAGAIRRDEEIGPVPGAG